MRLMLACRLGLVVCLAGLLSSANHVQAESRSGDSSRAPLLSLPLDCVPGKTCFVQNYVDIDRGPDLLDYSCGKAGYNGHKGVDFRVVTDVDMMRGVKVLAAAPGRVKGVRDGVIDRRFGGRGDLVRIKGKECGNGVVIAHVGGLVTQYCHMRRGSIRVRRGQRVQRGQKLGLVGLSGRTVFPHLHISVRRNKKIVDPFTGHGQNVGCGALKRQPLWTRKTLEAFPYRNGEVLKVDFARELVKIERLRKGHEYAVPRTKNAPAIGLYAWIIKLEAGDVVKFMIDGPRGRIVQYKGKPLPRQRAVFMRFVGRKRPKDGWPLGIYRGRVEVVRGGKVVISRAKEIEIN